MKEGRKVILGKKGKSVVGERESESGLMSE